MDTDLPISPLSLLAQPLTLAEGSSTEGGFDFSALFLGLTAGAEGAGGQNPQNPQTSLLFQATAATPESPAALLANSDTLETDADGEGQISHEAADDLLLRAGLLPFIPAPQMQEVQSPLLLAERAGAELTLLPSEEEAITPTQPHPFSIGKEGAMGLPALPDGSQQLHGLFSFDADAEQSGLPAIKAQGLDVARPGNMLQAPAVTSDTEQAVQSARQQLLSGPVSQNVQNVIDVTEQDQHNTHVLSTRISLRHTGLRTEPDVPEGIHESPLPLKNLTQTDRTLADRTLADPIAHRILTGRIAEQSPGLSRLGIGSSAQGQATPYAMAQDSGLLPNTEFDVTGPPLATQEAAGSDLFAAQAALKGLVPRGVQNDLEQPQAQQSRLAFAETTSVLSVGSSVQDEAQTASVLDAQRAEGLRHNILERVAMEMAARVQLNQREARIQLSPPELGGLKIELVVNGKQVHARIVAEVAEVGSLLKNNISDLKQALQSQGLDLSSVQVGVSSRGDGHGEQNGHNGHAEQAQQFQHDGGTSRGRQQHAAPSQENHDEGKTDEQQPGSAASVAASRGVNVRV